MFNPSSPILRPVLPPPAAEMLYRPPLPPPDPFWQRPKLQAHLASIVQNLAILKAIGDELEAIQSLDRLSSGTGHGLFVSGAPGGGIASSGQVSTHDADGLDSSSLPASQQILLKTVQENVSCWPDSASLATQAAHQLLGVLRVQLGPLQGVLDGSAGTERTLAAKKLASSRKKLIRNRGWRNRKRRIAAEALRKERERFEGADREADEWMAREIAKVISKRKMEKMKELAEKTSKDEKGRQQEEIEMGLLLEKLQELRALRILKLKKQGRFFPEEDDLFTERVRAAVEEEERQAAAAAATSAATAAILNAEEARKAASVSGRVSGPGDLEEKELQDPVPSDQPVELDAQQVSLHKSGTEPKKGSGKVDEREKRVPSSKENARVLPTGYEGLPAEFHHYYFGSSFDMGTLIEVRQAWDAFIMPGGSCIPQHWIEAPSPADPVWGSYLVKPKGKKRRRKSLQ